MKTKTEILRDMARSSGATAPAATPVTSAATPATPSTPSTPVVVEAAPVLTAQQRWYARLKASRAAGLTEATRAPRTRRVKVLADLEVAALRRVAKILSRTHVRLTKTASTCGDDAQRTILAAQVEIMARCEEINTVASTLIALRATEWARASKPANVAKEPSLASTMWIRAKFAPQFDGLLALSDDLTVVRNAGTNVIVTYKTSAASSGEATLVIARRFLTSMCEAKP